MIIEKDGQIIVTELRPMSEAPKRESVLLVTKINTFVFGYRFGISAEKDMFSIRGAGKYSPDNFLGWLPSPIYQPEQKPVYLECGE